MWVRDRLITSFNIYVYFPCKNIYIEKKNYDGVKIAGKLFFVFFSLISLHGEIFINAPLFTTYACVCIVYIFKRFWCACTHTHVAQAHLRDGGWKHAHLCHAFHHNAGHVAAVLPVLRRGGAGLLQGHSGAQGRDHEAVCGLA